MIFGHYAGSYSRLLATDSAFTSTEGQIYELLFHDQRGDDLVAYLSSLRTGDLSERAQQEKLWTLSLAAWSAANAEEGIQLCARYCGTCHDSEGPTRIAWHDAFHHLPIELSKAQYRTIDLGVPSSARALVIARIAKFGIPGTDMPGHEYLPDQQIGSMALWLSQQMTQSHLHGNTQN